MDWRISDRVVLSAAETSHGWRCRCLRASTSSPRTSPARSQTRRLTSTVGAQCERLTSLNWRNRLSTVSSLRRFSVVIDDRRSTVDCRLSWSWSVRSHELPTSRCWPRSSPRDQQQRQHSWKNPLNDWRTSRKLPRNDSHALSDNTASQLFHHCCRTINCNWSVHFYRPIVCYKSKASSYNIICLRE